MKRGLFSQPRTIAVMLDETIVTEIPPLYSCYGHIGQPVCVPIIGTRAKRIVHGAINVWSGDCLMLITDVWTEQTHQFFLQMIRSHWRGWNIWLYQDRGSPHTTEDSQQLALELGFTLRWLPKACPKLNAMDQLWRRAKAKTVASRPTISVDTSACWLCDYILDLSPTQRLHQAGVLSGNFWLAK